jgi:hypothetical protein
MEDVSELFLGQAYSRRQVPLGDASAENVRHALSSTAAVDQPGVGGNGAQPARILASASVGGASHDLHSLIIPQHRAPIQGSFDDPLVGLFNRVVA